MNVREIYEGSNGDATKALYVRLTELGPAGIIATNLFRACKCSERAKLYRGRGYRQEAYGRKNWSLSNLATALTEHSVPLGIRWGWREDPAQDFYRWVLYIETPYGQASFHTDTRLIGPDYTAEWDSRKPSKDRITDWCAALIGGDAVTIPPLTPGEPCASESEKELEDPLEAWKRKHLPRVKRAGRNSGILRLPGGDTRLPSSLGKGLASGVDGLLLDEMFRGGK
jgi:hypothetical protein